MEPTKEEDPRNGQLIARFRDILKCDARRIELEKEIEAANVLRKKTGTLDQAHYKRLLDERRRVTAKCKRMSEGAFEFIMDTHAENLFQRDEHGRFRYDVDGFRFFPIKHYSRFRMRWVRN